MSYAMLDIPQLEEFENTQKNIIDLQYTAGLSPSFCLFDLDWKIFQKQWETLSWSDLAMELEA